MFEPLAQALEDVFVAMAMDAREETRVREHIAVRPFVIVVAEVFMRSDRQIQALAFIQSGKAYHGQTGARLG